MIVKNEARSISRLLESVSSLVDYYVICDTGSTDNTVQIIRDFFNSKNIKGNILFQEFINFEHNRNFALQATLAAPAEYVLLLDADMKLENYSLDKTSLTKDYYLISQGTDNLEYNNIRIVRNDGRFRYCGTTHEFIETPPNATFSVIPRDVVRILDIGDGGSKSDKFERDIRLLKKSLETNPDDRRSHFYLANSYKNTNFFVQAIQHYKKRVSLGGWVEEIFMSLFEMGHCYKALGNEADMISAWLEAHQVHPQRLETLYELTKYYRLQSKHYLSEFMYSRAMEISSKHVSTDNFLFRNPQVYEYLFDVEKVIFSFYIDRRAPVDDSVLRVLARGDKESVDNVMSNLKHYKFVPRFVKDIDVSICYESQTSSSICIIHHENGYIANRRFVNYHICDDGRYVSHFDKINFCKNIKTENQKIFFDSDFKIVKTEMMNDDDDDDIMYIGIEDVRLYIHDDTIYFLGTQFRKDNRLGITFGNYKENILSGTSLTPEWNPDFRCEKNWSLATDLDGELVVIYKWHPLTIGSISGNYLTKKRDVRSPQFMRYARGSTCGSKLGDEWYFIIHFVSYEAPRHYYHMIVTLDECLRIKKYSRLFSFEGEPIEFSLSIIAEEERFIIGYSTWDRTSKIRIYDRAAFY